MRLSRLALGLACASWMHLASAQTLELAQARELDLDGLRGLGPATTQRILAERERHPFRDWKDLMRRVPGIGPRKAEQLSAQGLRVQGQAFPERPEEAR
ncbi:MAG: hypothetical protein RL559_230 [Pseudomonadota bacterium]|jgi:competence protein ComEA